MQGRRSMSSKREAPRLPRIAPRTGAEASPPQAQQHFPPPRNILPNVPRTRLPPRSRSGCWTCRRRKVKCDEQRPDCGQCARLGHDCDYTPRLAFKNDSSTAMKRTKDVTTTGNSVWDRSLPTPEYGIHLSGQDTLPPFPALTTDEDREKKAQMREAGTYFVVTNPSSFASLPEYCTSDLPSPLPASGPSDSDAHIRFRQRNFDVQFAREEPDDPNTIILKTFEDYVRRSPLSTISNSSPIFTTTAQPSVALETPTESAYVLSHNTDLGLSKLDQARRGGKDAHLLKHYRSHISEHVIKVGSLEADEDIFEIQARTFPPLFHAMMAISALSLAHRSGTRIAEASEHYAQVLTAMGRFVQSEPIWYSDGPLFTHYLLLLYEIASTGPWQYSNMWQSHSRTLLKIISDRWQENRREPHGFLVLVICLVDTYALLSGSGDGAFVDFIMKNDMLAPQDCLPPLAPGHPHRYFDNELPYFPIVLELNLGVIRLATKVGRIAQTLRVEDAQRQGNLGAAFNHEYDYKAGRRTRVHEIQNLCRTVAAEWQVRYPLYWLIQPAPKSLPRRVRNTCDHIYTLYRACVIYSHTSLYPGQMTELISDDGAANEVFTSATEIIEFSQQVVADERWELQFIPFALFLSGVVSRGKEEKAHALKLMTALEQESYGKTTATMRRLLETIYDKQQANRSGEQDLGVDWLEVMERSGLRLVMFGM